MLMLMYMNHLKVIKRIAWKLHKTPPLKCENSIFIDISINEFVFFDFIRLPRLFRSLIQNKQNPLSGGDGSFLSNKVIIIVLILPGHTTKYPTAGQQHPRGNLCKY